MRRLALIALGSTAVACSSPAPAPAPASRPATPYLTLLSVSPSGASSGIQSQLVPEFSPTVFDYYVRCAAGDNALDVSMTPSYGASSSLVSPTASPVQPGTTVAVTARENQAIVAVATAGSMTTEYWVRCLPHDFPQLAMVRHPEAGNASPGYYLVGDADLPLGISGYAMVLNGDAVPVWYGGRSAVSMGDVDSLMPGTISFTTTLTMGTFVIDRLAPWRTTHAAPKGEVLDTHELRVLENGHFLVIADPVKMGVDLTGVKATAPDGSVLTFGPGSNVLDCHVVEFEPTTGKVVWTWVGSEHFDPALATAEPSIAAETAADGAPIVEPFHCNSIDVDPKNGNLLVSARNMNSVFYIERPSGKVLWKIGGRSASVDGATYIPVTDPFYQQHDARIVSWSSNCGGSGQISVFDDHSWRPAPARGLVLDVVVGSEVGGGGGCPAGVKPSATVAWQYRGHGNSAIRGSFRIMPDDSRIIGWGNGAAPGLVFTEVDEGGDDLLDMYFPRGVASYRAIKVPLEAFELGNLRITAGR